MSGPRLVNPHFDEHDAKEFAGRLQPGQQMMGGDSRESKAEAMLDPIEIEPGEGVPDYMTETEFNPLNRILVAPSESWRTGRTIRR